jgi:hypothetical protein
MTNAIKYTFSAEIFCGNPEDLTPLQRKHMSKFETKEELIAEYKSYGRDFDADDVAPRAGIKIAIKARDVLRHSPNEGVVVYGARDADIDLIRELSAGNRVWCGTHPVEAWRD